MNKIHLLIIIIVSIVIGILSFKYFLQINTRFEHFRLNSLVEKNSFNKNTNFKKLLKGDILKLEFVSKIDNLGIVEINFNNYKKINKDKINFRIKEVGSDNWYYQSTYETSLIDIGEFFPFGFPALENSKSKRYEIEIESLNGTEEDSISLNENINYFKSKYIFNKEYIFKNPFFLPSFVLLKSIEIVSYLKWYQLIFVVVSIFLPYLIFKRVLNKKRLNFAKFKFNIKINYGLIAILSLFVVSHMQFINYSQLWDSEWYWQLLLSGVNNVSTNGKILDNFNFLGHPSMGYVSILSIGQFINFGNIQFLNLTNVILASISVISFYYLMKLFFNSQKRLVLMLTFLFAFNPLMYATTISLNLDFAVLVFATLSITFLFYKRYLPFLICALFLVFSKETGILIYGSIALSYFVFFRKNFWFLKYIFLIPVLSFVGYLYINDWSLWNSKALTNTGNRLALTWQNNSIFTFGFNYENIKLRLFQIFIMNFNWLMTPVVVVSFFKIKDTYFKFISLVFFIFILFNLIYTVMPFPRYIVPTSFFMITLFAFSLDAIKWSDTRKNVFTILIVCLMIAQTFKSIDPSPRIFYGSNNIGNNISSPVFGYRDALVYNSEFTFVDELSKMIKANTNKDVSFIINTGAQYFFKNIQEVGTLEKIDNIKYEKELEYIYVPWFSDREESLLILSKVYNVAFKNRIEYKGYYVDIYSLTK